MKIPSPLDVDDDDSIGLDDEVEPHPPGVPWPDELWVKFAVENLPEGGLDYRRELPAAEPPSISERNAKRKLRPAASTSVHALPVLLTIEEAAGLLRTSTGAIYSKVERGLLAGVVRDGRRILFHRDEFLRALTPRKGGRP